MSKQVILTGLRTNSVYHLGNYLGAIMPMVNMANQKAGQYQINMFAPDLHSFTTPIDHSKLYNQTLGNIKLFIACGLPIDHEDVVIYRQSRIPAHSEMTVILNNFSYFGELSRMTEFKEKSKFDISDDYNNNLKSTKDVSDHTLSTLSVSVGLFDYPVLMASDILLYDAQWVPVGEDQRQHLEFTRNLAKRFNNKFGKIFTVPKPTKEQQNFIERDAAPRIRSLRNPSKKMSKSIDDPTGTILLSDSPKDATKKIMSATTDNVGSINFNWTMQPGITNLLQILALLSGVSQKDINDIWIGKSNYAELKDAVAGILSIVLSSIQESLLQISDHDVISKLEESENKMNIVANEKLLKVQQAVGLR
jgi:tryptophanyl-tRNA synthetase